MSEEQIREVLAHIKEVRDRWAAATAQYLPEGYVDLDPDDDGLTLLDPGYDSTSYESLPWRVFADFDGAVAEYRRARDERDAAAAAQRERNEREQYERLRKKYE